MRIVIYDSGVGGLSIYQAVHAALPEHDYIFLSDNQAFPYGTKSEEDLLNRVHQVTHAVMDHYEPQLVIVACNTASTLALDSLRDTYDARFIGVVPAIKPAATLSQTRHIAVLATPATVERPYTKRLITEHAQGCRVDLIAAPSMVALAETKLRGEGVDLAELEKIMLPIKSDQSIDTLVLACTHYPLLKPEIKQVLGQDTHVKHIIDSADAIARRAMTVLSQMASEQGDKGQAPPTDAKQRVRQHTALFTRQENWSDEFLAYLEKLSFDQIDHIRV